MTEQANRNPAAGAPSLTGELCCAYLAPAAFSASECDRILAFGQSEPMQEGLVQRGGAAVGHDRRKCSISALYPTDENNRWILQRIIQICSEYNNRHFGFDITSVGMPLQLTQYPEGGEYGWHQDIGSGVLRQRKLSFSIQLSEASAYDGGEFETSPQTVAVMKDRGSLIVFPSFLRHRVAPVTRGERWALVGWILGPEWR